MPLQANDLVRIEIHGLSDEVPINNVFHYLVNPFTGGDTLAQMLTAFIADWRTNVLPLLSEEYFVDTYEAKIVDSVLRIVTADYPATMLPMKYRIRYRDQLEVAGVDPDDDGTDAGDALPTFSAIGVRKNLTGGLIIPAVYGGGTTGGKKIKGSCRMGPINEDLTEAAAGNTVAAATVTSWTTAMSNIRTHTFGAGSTASMVVPSFMQDGRLWNFVAPPADPEYTYVYSNVNTMTVKTKITSQVSRKEA